MKAIPVEILISDFIESIGTEKGFSENTCRGYRNDLEEFIRYLAQNRRPRGKDPVDIDGVDNITIRGYLGYLHKRNKKTTIARKLSALRSFFNFLVRRGVSGGQSGRINTYAQTGQNHSGLSSR